MAFGLAPLAETAERRGDEREAQVLKGSRVDPAPGRPRPADAARRDPPAEPGVDRAAGRAQRPLSPLRADGIETELHVDEAAHGASSDALVYRVAREALRNAQKYAEADTVRVDVTRPVPGPRGSPSPTTARASRPTDRVRRGEEGHVGLTLLESLVRQSDGTLAVRSDPGKGTTVELEVPAR